MKVNLFKYFWKRLFYTDLELAQKTDTPSYLLEELSMNSNEINKYYLSGHPSTPSHILEKLSGDESWWVRRNVADNYNTSVHVLEKLSEDEAEGVRNRAKGALNKRTFWNRSDVKTGIPCYEITGFSSSVQDRLEHIDTNAVESYLDPLVFEIYADLLKLSREDV
jgi:hypothetical protein